MKSVLNNTGEHKFPGAGRRAGWAVSMFGDREEPNEPWAG